MEVYFKRQLKYLLDSHGYDPHNVLDPKLLYYVYQPLIFRKCDVFVTYWNSHRIRAQHGICLPSGVPDHMFLFPERYGSSRMGISIGDDEELQNVAELCGVMGGTNYKDNCTLQKCRQIIPNPEEIPTHFVICNCNCNHILFNKLPWPGDSEGTLRSSSQAATCPPVYHKRRRLHTVPLIAERQAENL